MDQLPGIPPDRKAVGNVRRSSFQFVSGPKASPFFYCLRPSSTSAKRGKGVARVHCSRVVVVRRGVVVARQQSRFSYTMHCSFPQTDEPSDRPRRQPFTGTLRRERRAPASAALRRNVTGGLCGRSTYWVMPHRVQAHNLGAAPRVNTYKENLVASDQQVTASVVL